MKRKGRTIWLLQITDVINNKVLIIRALKNFEKAREALEKEAIERQEHLIIWGPKTLGFGICDVFKRNDFCYEIEIDDVLCEIVELVGVKLY